MNIRHWIGLAVLSALIITAPRSHADGWPAVSPGDPTGPGQPTTGMFITHPQNVAPNAGDWVSTNAGGATYYSYFVEVPPNTTNLIVEIFDPDLNQGVEGSSTSLPHYDQPRSGASSAVYTLHDPTGTTVQTLNGSATLPAASHASWFPFPSVAMAANGHWEVRVDSESGSGSVVNGYGVRARATVNGVANTQLRMYADAFLSVQNYGSSGVYVAHPYVTGFCQVRIRDFDADASGGGIGAASSITLSSGLPSPVTATVNGPTMSGNSNTDWATNDTVAAWHTDVLVARPGIYTTELRPRSTGATNEFQVGFFNPNAPGGATAPTVPSTGGSWANSWRTYLPTPDGTVDGTAPLKPYLTQRLFHAGDGSPNPPAVGQTGNYDIVIQMVNPTIYPIEFSATNLISSFIPGGTVVRAAATPVVSQGAIVAVPAAGASGTVSWNPGVIPAGQTVTLTYRVAVTPAALGRIVVTGTPAANGTSATYVDETANTTQARARYTWGPLCELAISTSTSVTTPATLASVTSRRDGDRVSVDVRTAVQVGVAYYELLELRGASREWRRVDGGITAAPLDSLEAGSVRLEGNVVSNQFMIRTVDIDGSTMLHGPFDVGAAIGSDPETRRIPWAQIREELQAFEVSDRNRTGSDADSFDVQVERAGIAQIRFEDLPSSTWNGANINGIGLYDRGQSVPIRVLSQDSVFGPGDRILFIADAANSLYSRARVYQLRRNQTEVARITSRRGLNTIAAQPQLLIENVAAIDADVVYNFSSPTPDPWHVSRLLATPTKPLTRSFSLPIDASRSGDVHLSAEFVGGIGLPGHEVQIAVNGTQVGILRFDGLGLGQFDTKVPASALLAGANSISLTMTSPNMSTDIVWLERLALRYQGSIRATAGAIGFTPLGGDFSTVPAADQLFAGGFDTDAASDSCIGIGGQNICQTARVSGVDASSARVFRRTLDGAVEELVGIGGGSAEVRWAEPRTLGREVFVADASGLVSAVVRPSERAVVLDGDAELLVITHPVFMEGVQSLAARRRAQGLSVQVVSTSAVYARYSGGNVDPAAIDQLIMAAVSRNRTRYVLLVGADTYDYQDRLGLGSISFLPSHYVRLHPVVNHAPTDGKYADTDGDLIPDVAIGRFPVRTAAELALVLQKINAYEAPGAAAGPSLFIADDRDPNGADFRSSSETLRARFSGATETAYLDDQSATQVRQRLLNAATTGAGMIHYLGHSSPSTWTFPAPGLITPAELFGGVLANAVRPTVVTQWGCWNSYLAAPLTDSMGHAWLLAPGGAVAVIGATSLTEVEHDVFLGYRLLDRWRIGQRIGSSLLESKRDMSIGDPDAVDVLLGTTLFGDPTLQRRE